MNSARLRPHLTGRTRTALVGALIIVVGAGASMLLARQWRSSALDTNRSSFQSTVRDLDNTLQSKLGADVRLTRTMRAIATLEPHASETRYLRWYRELQRGGANPSDVSAVLIEPIPAAGLAAFRRRSEGDAAFRWRLGGPFQILPPGKRPVYCVITAIVGVPARSSLFPGLEDYCAPVISEIGRAPIEPLIRTARDTGAFTVTSVPGFGSRSIVAIGVAVYRFGAPLKGVRERRAAATGSISTTFDSGELIRSVLADHPSLTLALYHRNRGGAPELVGRAGVHAKGHSADYSRRRYLGEGWATVASGSPDHPLAADTQGILALLLGLLITLLVFLIYRVLSGSRRHAWGLVNEKTGELAYRALHDRLTDLPNRTLVLDRTEQVMARARLLGKTVTALFVDIDDFKQINDRLGRAAGDEVLRQVGTRLRTVLRENDTIGRLGGDHFVMIVDSTGLDAAAELVAERILDVLRQPIELPDPADPPLSMTVSIGVATGLPASAENLMQDADLALDKAKASGKDSFALFESAMHVAAQDRIRMEQDLAGALDAGQLYLVYQPMLELDSERVVGVEALLRWRHPENGLIRPDVFIPIAEENGSIVALGHWVLEQACTQAAVWHLKGHPLNVSVNVSAHQLQRPEFVEEVRAVLHESMLAPTSLTLEITETVLMRRPDVTAGLLAELKALGVRIAVDDFGTGYSSLAYLRQFPVDSLKIDRTFITGLMRSSEARALTRTLIQLGKALGLQTLAEGVEDRDQLNELQREGCELVQGFLFARPLAPDVLEAFLEQQSGIAALADAGAAHALH